MKKNRKLTGVLALLILASTFAVSCAEKKSDDTSKDSGAVNQTTSPEGIQEETTTSALSTVEVNNYDGYTYSIITTNQDNRQVDYIAEQETGATLNDLVFKRNSRVAETFGVKIEAIDQDYGEINQLIQKDVSSNQSSYSLYATNSTAYSLASSGYLLSFNEVPHINLEGEWWDQNAIRDMSIAHKTFLATGDITPTGLLTSECLLFNKKLFDDNTMTYPYDMAFNGTWTLDVLYEMTRDLTQDTNGDGKIRVKDDLFSLTCWSDYPHAWFYGGGARMVLKDEDDIPYLAWDVDQYSSLFDKMYKILIDNQANYETSEHERSFKVFNESRAYFCGITFQKIETFLRDMEDDFGVLPNPKYDESQESYGTDVSGAGTMIVVPVSMENIETVGNITEAMACASYDMVTPSLIQVIASVKNVRDNESADIVQMVIRNRVFDITHQYGIPGDGFYCTLLQSKKNTVASSLERQKKSAEKQLQKMIDAFIENT